MVALADIQPSGFNPRKRFDETSLYELAESIKRQGVLQPITVRPVDGTDRYGIVFGERRYRASVIAGRDEIPAIVTELSDEEAEEMAITENLQRKDVTPVEEAAAYQRLIESGRHTVQTLAQLFGKNENYIRTRLKFTALIPEIAALLDADEITISVAAEICRYGEDIQREVYEKHLQDEGTYNSWRGLKAADVARRIEQNFTTDLQYYHFDKAECATCAHNTNNLLLFHDGGCGHCANRTCLAEMNASFLMERAVQIMRNQPEVSLCRDCYTANETVVERLTASGYEVETLDRYTAFPSCPKEPKAENFNDPERYGEARTRYEQQWADYMEQEEEITRRSGGNHRLCQNRAEGDYILLRGEHDRSADSGRNARTRTALTRGEIGEAGRAQQGNRTRTHGGGHQETDSRSRHHGRQVQCGRRYHVVLLPSVLAPEGTLRSRGDCGRQAVYHGRGQDGDYRKPHREDEDHHPQGLPCSQLQGSVREQHRGDPLA